MVSIFLATRTLAAEDRRASAESFIWTTDAWGGGGGERVSMGGLYLSDKREGGRRIKKSKGCTLYLRRWIGEREGGGWVRMHITQIFKDREDRGE